MATTSSSSPSRTWQWWVNVIAFVSLAIIGIVLLLSKAFGWEGEIPMALETIANALAYIVVASCAFVYASSKLKRKNGIWYMLIWAGAVILIIVAIIIPLVK